MKRWIGVVFCTALGLLGEVASAADMCLSEEAKKSISQCPNVGPQTFESHGKDPQVKFRGVADQKKAGKENKPGAPTQSAADFRDDRKSRLEQRALALLVSEISQTEQLNKVTDLRAKDRAQILRRLAESYVELENAAFREKILAEIERDKFAKAKNATEAGKAAATAKARGETATKARAAAIRHYTTLVDDYSGTPSKNFPQTPPPQYSQLDEVYYYLAYEYEQAVDYTNARRVYLDLIQKTPNSKYIPNAYLAFGELFFNEAMNDATKWEAARKAYEKVILQPPPQNKVYGYAWYKLAYVFWNTGDYPHALDAFKKTIDYGTQFAQIPNAKKLAESARRDVIPVYAVSGAPLKAYSFFKELSGDPAGTNTVTYKMMDDLGVNYIDTGHYPEAIELYRDLLTRDAGGDKTCAYQSHISEATMAMRSGDKPAIVKELDNQVKRYAQFKSENHAEDAKFECANRTAALVTETAMAWHLEAVGSQGQRGTGDPKTMDAASALYKKAGDTWTADEFAKFSFPRLVKEDWPNIYKIKYNMADLLYFRERWSDCGPAFDAVVLENPTAPEAAEAAYAAVLCYRNLYLADHKAGQARRGTGILNRAPQSIQEDESAKYKAKEMLPAQTAMLNSFNRYVCYIKPADADGKKQLVEVKYARARLYFEAQRWEEAAIAFREIAFSHADTEDAVYAAQLYLESINVLMFLGTPKRPQCVDDMAADVPKFVEGFCSGAKATANADTCLVLNKVQADLERLKIESEVKKGDELADRGDPNASLHYDKAGQGYFALGKKCHLDPIGEGKKSTCEKPEEIFYNCARAFQAGRLIASAIKCRMVLMNPTYQMEKTELAKDAMYEVGGNYQAIADYDNAADWFEKYQDAYPQRRKKGKDGKMTHAADQALSDAIVLRLGRGREDLAIKDAAKYQKDYGTQNPAQTAQIKFAVGAHYADKEEWDKARTTLQGAMDVIDRAPADIQLQAHAALARVLTKMGAARAKPEFNTVRQIWEKNGADIMKKMEVAYPAEDESARLRRIGKALEAVGEALFNAAEDKRKEVVEPMKFPVYTGTGTRDDVMKYNKDRLAPWVTKKKNAIESVEKEYAKVLDLKPAPPPKWVIAAASKAGLMWGDFFDEFGRAPTPKEWDRFPEVRAEYNMRLDEARLPLKNDRAKPALVKCLNKSVEVQYFDEFSRACETWLAKNYKTEYHVVDELRGTPTLSNGGLDDRPPPLLLGGGMWHPPSAAEKAKPMAESEDKKKEPKKDEKVDPKKKEPPKHEPAKKGGGR